MTVGGNRNALNREVGVDDQRDWSFGLFDCTSECGLCTSTSLLKLSYYLADIPWQSAVPSCVPAWSTLKINSGSDICSNEALLSRVGVID